MLATEPTSTDWIYAGSTALSAGAVWVGLLFAKSQLTSWRTQETAKKRADTAEKIMESALLVRDIFDTARHPFSSIPSSETKNKRYDYERRSALLRDNQSLFKELRLFQFKARLLAFDTRVESAVDEIFSVRGDFLNSLWLLSDYAEDPPSSKEERVLIVDARKTVFARGDGSDSVRKRLDDSIAILETQLGPTIRLNEN